MAAQRQSGESKQPMINEIEREAIDFAQSILKGPKSGKKEPLTKIEREAVTYAKNLLRKFCA